MKFAAIGRHEILLNSINLLCQAGHTLSYILTAKEAPEYRAGVVDFQKKGQELGVPVYVSTHINRQSLENMRAHEADVAVSMNFSTIISDAAIGGFQHGVLNAHGGDLPRYRGNACQAWALINGESKIGLCVHKMVGGELDSGDVIAKSTMPVNINTRIAEVAAWMEKATPGLFLTALEKLSSNPDYVLYRQSDIGVEPLRCFPRRPSDGRVNWARSAADVVRFINASGPPYAGAFFEFQGEMFTVHGAEWYSGGEYLAIPGQIAQVNGDMSVDVACAEGGYCRISDVVSKSGVVIKMGSIVKSVRERLA